MYSNIFQIITIPTGGGSINIDCADGVTLYEVDSTNGASVTLSGDYTIGYTGTPVEGTIAQFVYRGVVNLSGHQVTILGRSLTQEELLTKFILNAQWDSTLSQWNIVLIKDHDFNNREGIGSYTLTNVGGNVGLTPGIDKQYQIITGSPSLAGNWNFTNSIASYTPKDGDRFIFYYKATPTLNSYTISFYGTTLTDAQAVSGNLRIECIYRASNTTWYVSVLNDANAVGNIAPEQLSYNQSYDMVTYPVSFESGEQGKNTIKLNYPCYILGVYYTVTKALANTDAGTITCKLNGTTLGNGTISIPLSTTINTSVYTSFSSNNVAVYGDLFDAVTAKSTAGGKVLLTLHLCHKT